MAAVLLGATIGFLVALVGLLVGLELTIVLFNMAADLRVLRRLGEQTRQDQGH